MKNAASKAQEAAQEQNGQSAEQWYAQNWTERQPSSERIIEQLNNLNLPGLFTQNGISDETLVAHCKLTDGTREVYVCEYDPTTGEVHGYFVGFDLEAEWNTAEVETLGKEFVFDEDFQAQPMSTTIMH